MGQSVSHKWGGQGHRPTPTPNSYRELSLEEGGEVEGRVSRTHLSRPSEPLSLFRRTRGWGGRGVGETWCAQRYTSVLWKSARQVQLWS